ADPFGSLSKMSLLGPLIIAGVFAATLSSALGSFLGAPRILQAMGQDKILRPIEYFGVGHGPNNEPHRATVLSMFIAVSIVWAGGLDAVAQVISMFFLITYGMINLSAFVEGRAGNPSFRPRFKVFGWPAGLVGAIGCGYAMVKINETYAVVSMALAALVYLGLKGRTGGKWDDAKRGYIFARTRENLLLLESSQTDAKNWRPALAVITSDFERERALIQSAAWIESGRGILSVLELRRSDGNLVQRHEERTARLLKLKSLLKKNHIVAFSDSVVVNDPVAHLDTILQSYSIGSLRPNTVMFACPPAENKAQRTELALMMPVFSEYTLNVVIYKETVTPFESKKKSIDLWWSGKANGSLMAIFSYLVTTHDDWEHAKIRILRVVDDTSGRQAAALELESLVAASRINMQVKIIISQEPVIEIIKEESAMADLLLLGLAKRDVEHFAEFMAAQEARFSRMPRTLFVHSAGDMDLLA
ncbi:amino acid permease, partial [Myxococcota bacterium]|nr:amino acid permease [Myxococcota bacterium]